MKLSTRAYRKWIIFPCCLLFFGILEEVLDYKLRLIDHAHVRVACLMFFYVAGLSLIAYLLTPRLEKIMLGFHRRTRRGFGTLGEVVFIAALVLVTYYCWYVVFIHGIEALLPRSLHNRPGPL